MEVTREDLAYVVRTLRKKGIVTHEGAKQFMMQEKAKDSISAEPAKKDMNKVENDIFFPDNFLSEASRKVQSSPPLIRINE